VAANRSRLGQERRSGRQLPEPVANRPDRSPEAGPRRYGFQIVSVKLLHPLQAAPVIVIRSNNNLPIAHATPAIIELFDPRHVTKRNPSGYAYEAYFFEARDGHGVPYLATFNHWRAPGVGGGEWAADESLYPFPHG
jgi:hypothetical protein